MRSMPSFMVREFVENMHALGRGLGETGEFDPEAVRRFSKDEKLPLLRLWFMGTLGDRMESALFWHREMKKNGAYERREARPYAEPPPGW